MAEGYQGYQSLSHSKWDCKYHVVFILKKRPKALFGRARHHLGEIFHALARQKGCQIVEGHVMPDYVHMRAKPYLRTRQNLIHTQIVLQYALKLLKEEKGSEEVVIPAVLLHDVGWDTIPEGLHLTAFGPNLSNPELAKVYEVEGTKIAKKILETLHYPPEKAKEICQIIPGYDTRNRSISRNDRIVKDSGKLFRYSRRGLAIDMDRFRISRSSRLNFLEKQVEEWFFLPTSRQLATGEVARRRKEMKKR